MQKKNTKYFSILQKMTLGSVLTYISLTKQNCSLVIQEVDGGPRVHHNKTNHKIMVNAQSFEIYCMECNTEIFDLEV